MDPNGDNYSTIIENAEKIEKRADYYGSALKWASGKGKLFKLLSKHGGDEILSHLGIETNIGNALLTYFAKVGSALVEGFKKANFKNSYTIDQTGYRPGYLLVERTTVSHGWFSTQVTVDYFVLTNRNGGSFKNLNAALDYYFSRRGPKVSILDS